MQLPWLEQVEIYDCHEHLYFPEERVERESDLIDMIHYTLSDFKTAGLQEVTTLQDFFKWYPMIRHTGYGQMIRIIAKDLYNIELYDYDSFVRLDRVIRAKSQNINICKEWYGQIFQRCNIKKALTVYNGSFWQNEQLAPMVYLDFLIQPNHIKSIKQSKGIHTLDAYVEYVIDTLTLYKEKGMIAGKFGTPYWHSLEFCSPDIHIASQQFSCAQNGFEHLAGYLFHQILGLMETYEIPVQFHTGHVEPRSVDFLSYRVEWSNPDIFGVYATTYPKLRCILLHTGYPFQDIYFSLAKNHANIYVDFSWIYIISPKAAQDALIKSIEMIPINKIIGFGGDCQHIEGTYAHLQLAKSVWQSAFTYLIENKWLDESSAKYIFTRIAQTNPLMVYKGLIG